MRLCLCVTLLSVWFLPVTAQVVPTTGSSSAPVETAPSPSPNDVKELIRLLGDEGVQEWLKESAAEKAEPEDAAPESLRELVDSKLAGVAHRAQALGLAWNIIPQMPMVLAQEWEGELSHAQKVRSLTYVLTFLLIGLGLEWLYRQFTRLTLLRVEQAPKDAPMEKLTGAAIRAAIIFGGLTIFAIGSIGAFRSFDWHPIVSAVVLDFLVMILLFRVITTVSLFFQAPHAPELRLVPYGERIAKFLHWVVRIFALSLVVALGLSYILIRVAQSHEMMEEVTGQHTMASNLEAVALAQTVGLAFGVVVVAWICIFVAFRRVPQMAQTALDMPSVRMWRNYMMVLVAAVFGTWLLGMFPFMWAILILGLLVPATKLMYAWIDHFFDQSTQALHDAHMERAQADLQRFLEQEAAGETLEGEAQPDVPEFHDPYVTSRPIVQRAARFVLWMGSIFVLAAAWGINIFDNSTDRNLLGTVLEILVDSIFALLVADLIWTWAKTVIDKRVADYEPPVDGQAPGPEARMITLLPLLRTILMVALLIMVSLSVLSAAGINIAPILAGAGIMGIAIGFGTQSLVRDIVAGIFFLIDDAFRLGEYIEVGNLMGTVESISVRSMRIRHHRGKVHTVPYGELKSLTNHSRDWVIMKLEFRVPFDTDLQLVKKLVKKVGAELKANEHYGPSILSTLKSQGVRRMEEFNMVVGVKFMTKPGEQWLVRRDAYQKVRDIFEANGIRMAERNVKVAIEGGDALSEEQRQAVAGAAQEASQGPAGPPKPVPDEP